MNPLATITMENGKKILIELLPEIAPNTVNSFLYAVDKHVYDNHIIERIVPGSWIDVSYSAFFNDDAKYLIPYEHVLNPNLPIEVSKVGDICMGGYDEDGQSGCEFFFPLRECPDHLGVYPVFGKIIDGLDEILRIASVPTTPVLDIPLAEIIEINKPIVPEIIKHVTVELNGYVPKEPIKMPEQKLPESW